MASKTRTKLKNARRLRRRRHIRHQVAGTAERPRMTVYRSLAHIYVQLIDDEGGKTLCSASTMEKDQRTQRGGNKDAAERVGRMVAERAKEKGVARIVFDRNGYKFHGRVKALAEAARAAGLEF